MSCEPLVFVDSAGQTTSANSLRMRQDKKGYQLSRMTSSGSKFQAKRKLSLHSNPTDTHIHTAAPAVFSSTQRGRWPNRCGCSCFRYCLGILGLARWEFESRAQISTVVQGKVATTYMSYSLNSFQGLGFWV